MADSRRASALHMKQIERIVENQRHVISFLMSLIAAFLATFWLGGEGFTEAQDYVLFLLFFSIGLWVTEAIPPFAVGILIVGFLVFFLGNPNVTGAEDIHVKKFVNTWSNSVIWLLLGGFFLAKGMKKTGLDKTVFRISVSSFSTKPRYVLLGIMGATALGSMIMSNTAITAMMIAAVMPLVNKDKERPLAKALILGIPAAAAIGGMGTIIGSPPNAIAVDFINNIKQLDFQIGFLEWMLFGVPVVVILLTGFWYILLRYFNLGNIPVPPEEFEMKVLDDDPENIYALERRRRKRVVTVTLAVTVLLWLTSKLHGIPAAAVSGIPIILFTMLNIITGEDVRSLPWDTLMLVAGGLSLGLAISETGLAEYFIGQMNDVTLAPVFLAIIFSLVTVIFSNIMSNTATATILIPMAGLWAGINPLLLPLVIGLAASCALFLPVSTPPNAIAYSTGLLEQKDFRLGGIYAGLFGPVIIIIWTMALLSFVF
jgi:sodium-dependent dicarboxylate transporter 2/3/5